MKKRLSPVKIVAIMLAMASPVMFLGCSADDLTGAEMQNDAPAEVAPTGDSGPSLSSTDPDAAENTP
jgi:hypothetical protein